MKKPRITVLPKVVIRKHVTETIVRDKTEENLSKLIKDLIT